MDRGENPDSPSDTSSQTSNEGREDSKDKDMKPSDGRKTNGSHEPPPQYADMAGQVPTSPGVSYVLCFEAKYHIPTLFKECTLYRFICGHLVLPYLQIDLWKFGKGQLISE